MISTATAGGTVTNYSPRFSLSGMTGTFPPPVIEGLKTIQGTQGPSDVNSVSDAKNNPAADGPFNVDYRSQTGLTKYAPSQPIPPTKITARSAKPLYPTSAVVYAKTWLPIPSQVTTFTQSGTFSVSSVENTVSISLLAL